VGGTTVALVPLTAGNGLEAIRHAVGDATLGVAAALLLAKFVATTASIGCGAPGGVMSPSLAVAGGAALMGDVALRALGADLGAARWDAMLAVMAVGIAVSVRAPLTAVFMVAELAGDLRLVPLTALAVALAWGLGRVVDRWSEQRAGSTPPIVDDRAEVRAEDG
jgi:chloride channel protein, CIC family